MSGAVEHTTNGALLDREVVEELTAEWSRDVGRRLRKRRKDLGFTLDQVAALAGVSKQTVHRAEYDGATIRDAQRYLLAMALCLEVADLWSPMTNEQLRTRAKAVA